MSSLEERVQQHRKEWAQKLREMAEDASIPEYLRSRCRAIADELDPPPPPPPKPGKPVRDWKSARQWLVQFWHGKGVKGNATKELINFFAWREARGYEDMRGSEAAEFVADALMGKITPYTPGEINKQLREEYNDWDDNDGAYDLRDELEAWFEGGNEQ